MSVILGQRELLKHERKAGIQEQQDTQVLTVQSLSAPNGHVDDEREEAPDVTKARENAAFRDVMIVTTSGSNSVVECQLPKLDVAGSSPVSRSIFNKLATIKNAALRCTPLRRLPTRHPDDLRFSKHLLF